MSLRISEVESNESITVDINQSDKIDDCISAEEDFINYSKSPVFIQEEYSEHQIMSEYPYQCQPKSFLCWSILNFVLSFFSGFLSSYFAIPALYFSYKTKDERAKSNYVRAKKFSKYSKLMNILATVFIILGTSFILLILFRYFKRFKMIFFKD